MGIQSFFLYLTCVWIVLHWIEIFERLKALGRLELFLFGVGEQLCQLFVECPQRVDLPESPLDVDGLLGRVRAALPQMGRVRDPEQTGQLLANVDPFLTQVDSLKNK